MSEKKYRDINGEPRTLREMIRREPQWAESIFSGMETEIARLQAIEDRLDKTVDGVVIVPDDDVWDRMVFTDGRPPLIERHETCLASYTGDYYDPHPTNTDTAYSTKAAAEAARESQK